MRNGVAKLRGRLRWLMKLVDPRPSFVSVFGVLSVVGLLSLTIACVEKDYETIDGVIEFLGDNGYVVGPRSESEVIYISALDGVGVHVNGHQVLIYEFPKEESVEFGVEYIEKILQKGTGFWKFDRENAAVPYFSKGKVLLFLGDHPDAQEIISLVESSLPSLLDLD